MMINSRTLKSLLNLFFAFVLLITLSATVKPVSAGTITVTNTNNTGPGSLRQALLDANSGDTIEFDSSLSGHTITVEGDPLFVQNNVTIDGTALAQKIKISGDDKTRVFGVFEGVSVTMKNIEIINGYIGGFLHKDGAGIYLQKNANAYLYDCNFNFNRAKGNGGAIAVGENGRVEAYDCIFYKNKAQDEDYSSGGAIYNLGYLEVNDSYFTANHAVHGGAIKNSDAATLISSNNSYYQNSADQEGGVIYNLGDLNVDRDTFWYNSALYGGGINNEYILTVELSQFLHNSGGIQGGAIKNVGQVEISDSTFNNNDAHFGGAILNWNSMEINTSTFYGNSAFYGGAMRNWGEYGFLLIKNSTISGNQAEQGGGIQNLAGGNFASYYNTIAFNKATDKGAGVLNGVDSTLVYSSTLIARSIGDDCVNSGEIYYQSHNFVGDGSCDAEFSGNPKIGPLASNNGPTQTHALLPGSPAIDAAYNINCPATDQRGIARPYGAGCDIGAFEFNPIYPYFDWLKNFIPVFSR